MKFLFSSLALLRKGTDKGGKNMLRIESVNGSTQHASQKGNANIPEELLIRVDDQDRILGYDSKNLCHHCPGLLHRAFSIFIFNNQGQLLLQKRSAEKLLWPLYWSNSVCSHPREGESYEAATARRLDEELNIAVPLQFLFKFQYQAGFKDIGSENELCSVYIGKYDGPIQANKHEIADWKYVDLDKLHRNLLEQSEAYTPWFKLEWDRIQQKYLSYIENL